MGFGKHKPGPTFDSEVIEHQANGGAAHCSTAMFPFLTSKGTLRGTLRNHVLAPPWMQIMGGPILDGQAR